MDNIISDRYGGSTLAERSDRWNFTPENGLASERSMKPDECAVITDPLTLDGKWIGLDIVL